MPWPSSTPSVWMEKLGHGMRLAEVDAPGALQGRTLREMPRGRGLREALRGRRIAVAELSREPLHVVKAVAPDLRLSGLL